MHSVDRIRGGVMHVSRFRSLSRTEGLTRPRGADLSGGFVRVLGLVCVSSGWFFLLVRLRVDVRAISCRTDVSVIFTVCCFGFFPSFARIMLWSWERRKRRGA